MSTNPVKPQRNNLCPCGSGKKYKKCCALITQASRRVEVTGDLGSSSFQAAMKYFQSGYLLEAVSICNRCFQKQPENTQLINLSAIISHQINGYMKGC